jgi:hypothetical protein
MSPQRREALFLGSVLTVLALIQGVHLTRPFLRHHESVGTEVSKHARNHLKFGLSKTYGLKLDVSGPSLEPYGEYRRYFYSNHPPLPPLIMAVVFAVAGVSEAAYRVALILCSLGALILFRRVAARLLPAPADRAATLIFGAFPMFAYYSIVTALQVTALLGILSALLFYLRWRDGGRKWDYAGLLASIAFGCFCAWPGYYVALVLVAAHVRSGQPRTRAVVALLGWNLVIFGVYLLQLWIASPPDLDPLRKLLSAGFDRATPRGLSLSGYVLGEARELAMMMTLPALLLALTGLFAPRSGGIMPNDRLIAALTLLGLDEILFARLASQHEYYSYFLIVVVALAGGAGLARIAKRLAAFRPKLVVPVTAGLLGLVLIQSATMLHRRLTTEGGYEFYYRLGLAIREGVPENDRIFVLTDNIPFYTPYYGDRAFLWYDASSRSLMAENTGARQSNVSEDDLLRFLRENPRRLEWAVTADKDVTVPAVPWLQGLEDRQLAAFGVETKRTPRREFLEQRCGAPRVYGGFLFWSLK